MGQHICPLYLIPLLIFCTKAILVFFIPHLLVGLMGDCSCISVPLTHFVTVSNWLLSLSVLTRIFICMAMSEPRVYHKQTVVFGREVRR